MTIPSAGDDEIGLSDHSQVDGRSVSAEKARAARIEKGFPNGYTGSAEEPHGEPAPTPEGELPLFQDRQPAVVIQSEKPEHRMAVLLKAQGFTNNEIAERLRLTPGRVSIILRQPWARKALLHEFNRSTSSAIDEILRVSAEDSIFTLIELRDSAESEAVRRAAADSILDRHLGKPTQRVESVNITATPGDLEKLEADIAAIEEEERQLLGINHDDTDA